MKKVKEDEVLMLVDKNGNWSKITAYGEPVESDEEGVLNTIQLETEPIKPTE